MKAATRLSPMHQTGRNIRIEHTQMRCQQVLSHIQHAKKNKEKQTNSMFVSRLSLRNRMCVKSRDAQNATQIQAPYGSMLRRYTGRRRTLPRNSGAITRARRPSPGSLGGTARVARQGNFRWAGIRTKGSTTTLPQNRTIVCRSSLSRQRSPW